MSVDKQMVRARFGRHFEQYEREATVQRRIADSLVELLSRACPQCAPARALEIGMGTGFLSRRLVANYPECQWFFNDLAQEAASWVPREVQNYHFLAGDIEQIDLPCHLDLVASTSSLQWLDDLAGFLGRVHAALSPQGVFAFSSFGPQHMFQLRALTSAGLHYPERCEMAALLKEKGFKLLLSHEWQEDLAFASARKVLEHLRDTGVNATAAPVWTPRRLAHFEQEYQERFTRADGSYLLSYHPLLFLAQRV